MFNTSLPAIWNPAPSATDKNFGYDTFKLGTSS